MDMEKIKNKLQAVLPDGEILDKELLEEVVGGLNAGSYSEADLLARAKANGIRGISSLAGRRKLFDAKDGKNSGPGLTH